MLFRSHVESCSRKLGGECTPRCIQTIVKYAELLRGPRCPHPSALRCAVNHALKSAHFRAVRRPPLTLAVPSGDRQLLGMSRCDTLHSGAAVWRDLRNATQAAPALSAERRRWRVAGSRYGSKWRAQHSSGTMSRASPRGVALLGARPPATPWALNAQKSSIFAHRRSPRGQCERRLAVGLRQTRLGAITCALQRLSGANSAPPPRCLGGCTEVRRGASRGRMVVSTEV